MQFDPLSNRYQSGRNMVFAENGMVCTSQPLAAQAGLEILRRGGNAADAAIATAAVLTVCEPTSNGIGGDAFALVWDNGTVHGLNASGPSPASLSLDALSSQDPLTIKRHGWEPVTVPGVPAAWAALSEKFGKARFIDLFADAIRYASEGYPVAPTTAYYWQRAYENYKKNFTGELFDEWFKVFAPNGRAPKAGEKWSSTGHAHSLEAIAFTKGESFYRGEIADLIGHYSRMTGGFITTTDLAYYKPEWVKPISVNYKGHDVWEIPPNGQGMVALSALGMLNDDSVASMTAVERAHLQIEALKLAFADAHAYVTDSRYMKITADALLANAYLKKRRSMITDYAIDPVCGTPDRGGTVYLATADKNGMMVSYIQSNYMGFGSGIVIPGTGIAMQNRGCNFSTDSSHPNCLAPSKRPYHTIIPGFLSKSGTAIGPFGVMGGFMQPQGHLQVIINSIDLAYNPQEALDAPRFQWMEGKKVIVERSFENTIVDALLLKGHDIAFSNDSGLFGRGQIIWRNDVGVLCGGTEIRTDGTIAAF